MELLQNIPKDFIHFILIVVFSLLIGLEQRLKQQSEHSQSIFGSDRTYALTGILGFILYIVSPENYILYILGGFSLIVFLAIFYFKKIKHHKEFGITSMITLLITYGLTPLIYNKPLWLTLAVVTVVLILIQLKKQFRTFSKKLNPEEFLTIAGFLVMSGVILPLLPDEIIFEMIPISPYKFWLAVVVVSGISYTGYLLQKFIFPENGILITGLIGGLYSSTATTIVLAKKSKENNTFSSQIASSVILATSMMFLRIFVIAFIFNQELALILLPFLAGLFTIAITIALLLYKFGKKPVQKPLVKYQPDRNPLEFKTALLFAALFVVFGVITELVLKNFGQGGLNLLSIIVGVTDIDPFLLSLFTGKYSVEIHFIAASSLIAITSNNIIKPVYAIWFGSKEIWKPLILSFSVLILSGVVMILFLIL